MTENAREPIYEMSVNVRVSWQAHSLSTAGNNGSNRLLPRRQLLADKTETDAISGNIAKHHHAALVAEYFAADGSPLCPACRVGDGRRAAALIDRPDYQDLSKEEGQMIMKIPTRSGEYALCVRYHCVGIGADTERWILFVKNQAEREKRHRAVLRALRDSLVSPDGAHVATMLPHLTGLSGAITVRTGVGRSPLYSALEGDFITRLRAMADETCRVYAFETVDAFYTLMNDFIAMSVPALHPFWWSERAEQ